MKCPTPSLVVFSGDTDTTSSTTESRSPSSSGIKNSASLEALTKVLPGRGTRIAIPAAGRTPPGTHGCGISQPISNPGGPTRPPHTRGRELGVPIRRVVVAHQRGEMLDPGSADRRSGNPGLGACAHHLQRVLVGPERVLVTDVVSHMVSADSLEAARKHESNGRGIYASGAAHRGAPSLLDDVQAVGRRTQRRADLHRCDPRPCLRWHIASPKILAGFLHDERVPARHRYPIPAHGM